MDSRLNNGYTSHPKESMTEAEKAWLASAIDGEGSIFMPNVKGKQQVRVAIYNTSREYVEFAAKLMGVNSRQVSTLKSGKPFYGAYQQGRQGCRIVLEQILPYLIIKKDRAERLLQWIHSNPNRPRSENFRGFWKERGIEEGMVSLSCLNCGQTFSVWRSRVRKFCKRGCYLAWRKNHSEARVGVRQ